MLINYSLNFAPDLMGAGLVPNKVEIVARRRRNLQQWAEEHGVPASEKSYFSQLINGTASFGEKAARRLEDQYKMGEGFLDSNDDKSFDVPSPIKSQRAADNTIDVPEYRDAIGSMGRGITLKDQPGQITSIRVTGEWLDKNVPSNTGRQNLCIVTGFGDSMKGMYNSGDPLLVDTGIKTCEYDGVYFFRVGDEGFIKRLQRIPGEGIRVISENKKYETWTIRPDMDFEVFAKVLKVWESTDF